LCLYCDDDDDCVITKNDITGGRWLIGDPATNVGGVTTVVDPLEILAGDLWPHQVRSWEYAQGGKWEGVDPQLTVTEEPPPEYPENLIVKDLTGDRANLEGVYRRQGDSRVWKYGDFKFSFNGKLWCISGDNLDCQTVVGWDYAEDFIWPNTDTLYMIDYPTSITVTSTGPAAEEHPNLMGLYNKDDEVANLRPVYKKTDRDYFIFYDSYGRWKIGSDITTASGWIRSENRGLLAIPTSGWEWGDGTCGAACWVADPDLKFNQTSAF